MVANESVLEARTLKVASRMRMRTRATLRNVICLKGVVTHLSFREVSLLMQLCRKTRYSSTMHKAQKATYLDLLKKG